MILILKKASFALKNIGNIYNKIRLLSSDNYILKDSNNNYLIPKEDK